jgi:Kef-type K+ transport system membrane component KefB
VGVTIEVSFDDLLAVMALAVLIPLVLGLLPRLPIPSSVVEIAAGIIVGPALLDVVHADATIQVFAKLGVAILLFLAGLELDFSKLRGRPLVLGVWAFLLSLVLGLALCYPLGWSDVIIDPLLVAIILSSTSLGIVAPVLKDSGLLDTVTGRFVIAACSVAEFGSIVVLSMFFTQKGTADPLVTLLKLAGLAVIVVVIGVLATRPARWRSRVDDVLFRLQDSSSQLRVRGAMLLMIALVVLSEGLKFDAILGSFLAGAMLAAVTDRSREEEFGNVRHKLEAIGFGFFVPIFFISTGLSFPIDQLFSDSSALLRVPLFLTLLLAVRGIQALLIRRDIRRAAVVPAGLLQATSLSFIVVGAQIGVAVGELRPINAASLVAAGMLSVLLFPALALVGLRKAPREGVVREHFGGFEE